MKVELDISDPIVELMQAFKQVASNVIDKEVAAELGINLDDLDDPENLNGFANVLLFAGLKHFKEELEEQMKPLSTLKKFMVEKLSASVEDGEGFSMGIGRMVVGANGVELSGDIPEELRGALQGFGESLRDGLSDAMGETGDDNCDCPSCQFRRAHHPTKGKFS